MKTCGQCGYAVLGALGPDGVDLSKRFCFGYPPTSIVTGPNLINNLINIRPVVDVHDRACSLFKEVEIGVFETDDPKQIVLTSPIDRTRMG